MLLQDRNAVVYGGGGSIGGAVARAFAREGATVFLAGRTREPLERVARDITAAEGTAEVAQVDALDEQAVERFVDGVAERAGGLHVSFTAINHGDVHGIPLFDMSLDDFFRPIDTAIRAQFITARAAARHMVAQGSGVIMAITATTARQAIPNVGGTGVTFDAIESQCRQWACELGPRGVRVVWLHTTGIPEALEEGLDVFPDYGEGSMSREGFIAWMQEKTPMNRLTSLAEVGNAAAFLASDHASAMTACGLNLTRGAVPTR